MNRRDALWLAAFVVAGAVLRAHGLSTGLWRDEGSTYFDATAPSLLATLREIRVAEINPPGFFLLMRGWLALAGTSDLTMRLPAFAFGLAVIPATYALGRAAGSRATGLVAAACAAAGAPGLDLASDARPYTCAAFLGALATLAAFRVLDARPGERLARLGAYVAAAVALEYTTYTGLVLAFGLTLGALAVALAFARARANAFAFVAASAAVALALAPWLLWVRGARAVEAAWLVPMGRGELPGRILEQVGFVLPTAFAHVQLSIALLLAFAVALARRRSDPALLAGTVALVTGLASEAGALLREPRYAFAFVPLADALVALAVVALVRACAAFASGRERTAGTGFAAALGIALAVTLVQGAHVQAEAWAQALAGPPRSGMRALVAGARAELGPRTLIVVAPDYLGPSLGYYLRDEPGSAVVGFANRYRPEHFRCCGAWRRPDLVAAAARDILTRSRGFERVALVYEPGAVDRGTVPYGKALELRRRLDAALPMLWDRRYPGSLEATGMTLLAVPAAQSRPSRSST
jgi:hypothetical protein